METSSEVQFAATGRLFTGSLKFSFSMKRPKHHLPKHEEFSRQIRFFQLGRTSSTKIGNDKNVIPFKSILRKHWDSLFHFFPPLSQMRLDDRTV